jgi:hypothetical protein
MKRNTPSDRERHEVIEEHDGQLFTTSLNAVQMFAGPFASTRKALIQNRESSGGKKKVQRKSRFREKMNHYHDSAEAILSSSSSHSAFALTDLDVRLSRIRQGLHNNKYFVAQSHTPHDR